MGISTGRDTLVIWWTSDHLIKPAASAASPETPLPGHDIFCMLVASNIQQPYRITGVHSCFSAINITFVRNVKKPPNHDNMMKIWMFALMEVALRFGQC